MSTLVPGLLRLIYLYWRQVGVWQCLTGLGRAPEGALPWQELGMGHEEPVAAEDMLVLSNQKEILYLSLKKKMIYFQGEN